MTPPPGNEDGGQHLYSEDLKKKTRSSILWTLCRVASDQVFSWVVFVILARLLSPHEIGTFAIACAFSEVGRIIAVGGLAQDGRRTKMATREGGGTTLSPLFQTGGCCE